MTEGRWKANEHAPCVPPLEAQSLPLVAAVQAEAALALLAAESGVLLPLLYVPAVTAPHTGKWPVIVPKDSMIPQLAPRTRARVLHAVRWLPCDFKDAE